MGGERTARRKESRAVHVTRLFFGRSFNLSLSFYLSMFYSSCYISFFPRRKVAKKSLVKERGEIILYIGI